jgi:hypothetical protein
MPLRCITVTLPCHSLDGLATVSPEQADGFLSAWTAAWHPAALVACGTVPEWRGLGSESEATSEPMPDLPRSGDEHADDFQAVGLARLLAEMLARRMRTESGIQASGFAEAVLEAARAAVAGDAGAVRERLREAFACLETSRARYYPVESWAIDTVLLTAPVDSQRAVSDLAGPVPQAVVATGETLRQLAESAPEVIATVREAVGAGRIEPCGGRDAEEPIDQLVPESLLDAFRRGRASWQETVGAAPVCQAAISGGSSAMLPQLLTSLGYAAALWSLCDGSRLPDPGGGRIRWEGTGGGGIEAVSRSPLDAGGIASAIGIPDALGDAMDQDHVAVIQFASYAGHASRWHRLVRRIGSWSTLLGSFVTPSKLVHETIGSATTANFAADAFPPATSVDRRAQSELVAATAAEARRLLGEADGRRSLLAGGSPPTRPRPVASQPARPGLWQRLLGRQPPAEPLVLDHGLVRVEMHPRTGGLLSVRRPEDRANRLSQQLALRTTPPARPGGGETADERAEFTRMEADSVLREGDLATGRLESRGRLVNAAGQVAGRFVQRVELASGLPLALIEIEVEFARPCEGGLFEEHAACRFAWHENESVDIRRSLHLQAIATERTRFTAPHFIELAIDGRLAQDSVVILPGGLPWHVRSSPHVLDSLLPEAGGRAAGRLAVGVGLPRPWEAALALAGGKLPFAGLRLPANVRLTGGSPASARVDGGVRIGFVESLGLRGEVRIEWARPVRRCTASDAQGRPLPHVHVAIAGSATVVFLDRYQWLHLEIEFEDAAATAIDGQESTA